MCNCTSGNLEIPGLRFAHPGMTVSIVDLILRSSVFAASRRMSRAGLMVRDAQDALLTMRGIDLPRADQRQGLIALEQIEQAAQRLAARAL
jgi:hypothetical protein